MTQATAVRIFLLGLPLGLIILSAASLIWHFSRPAPEKNSPVFATLADEITPVALKQFTENLSDIIGPRHLTDPGTLERAANYLESTLGERNIGYEVARQEFEVDGQIVRNLWVEIPGRKRRNECLVLAAHYDAPRGEKGANDNASGVAALLALAENLIRDVPVRTIRLAFLGNGAAPYSGTENSGAAHFARLLDRQGEQVRAVLCLDSVGAFPVTYAPAPLVAPYLPEGGAFLSVLGREQNSSLLETVWGSLSRTLTFTVHQALLEEEAATFFKAKGLAPFLEAGHPALLVAGSGLFDEGELDVDPDRLAEVTRSLATLVRILSNPR